MSKVLPFTKPIPFPKKGVVEVGLDVRISVEPSPPEQKAKTVPPLDSPQK